MQKLKELPGVLRNLRKLYHNLENTELTWGWKWYNGFTKELLSGIIWWFCSTDKD